MSNDESLKRTYDERLREREEISMDDHLRLLGRLHRLEKAVQNAIDSLGNGNFCEVTPAEAAEHAARYGEGAWVIGEFVITERKPQPRYVAPPASDFDEWIAPF